MHNIKHQSKFFLFNYNYYINLSYIITIII